MRGTGRNTAEHSETKSQKQKRNLAMQTNIIPEDGYSVIQLSGKLDTDTAVKVDAVFAQTVELQNHLLVDLSALRYISSAGLRILLLAAKRVQQKGGKIILYALQENVRDIFDISGFSSVFKICKDKESAIAALKD